MKATNKVTAIMAVCSVLVLGAVSASVITHNKTKVTPTIEVASISNEETSTDEIMSEHQNLEPANIANNQVTNEPQEEHQALMKSVQDEDEIITLDDEIEVKPEELVEEAVFSQVEDTIVATLSLSEPEFKFDKVLPKVSEFLNIRSEAKAEADVVGKLYKNSYAQIIERNDKWTKIKSGDVTGYASNDYLYFDDDAVKVAKSLDAFKLKITAGSVNVRTKPTTDGDILEKAAKDQTFTHIPEMDTEEWYAILSEDESLAYINKQYASEKFSLKTAVSKAEEEEAKKKAEAARALEEAKKTKPAQTNRKAITVSDEDIFLLATVVMMEAGGESYEGQLAVANVVINRMLDGYWGKTIPAVVYAKGQFSGANSGRIEKYAPKVTESCKRAAVEALAGNNNIGDYKYFIMKNRAKTSSYKKYYILGCHCFYAR